MARAAYKLYSGSDAVTDYHAFPDRGRVSFRGADVTRVPNWRRVAMGMGRTFQTPSIFPELSVDENVRLGVRADNAGGEETTPVVAFAIDDAIGTRPLPSLVAIITA